MCDISRYQQTITVIVEHFVRTNKTDFTAYDVYVKAREIAQENDASFQSGKGWFETLGERYTHQDFSVAVRRMAEGQMFPVSVGMIHPTLPGRPIVYTHTMETVETLARYGMGDPAPAPAELPATTEE